MPVSSGPRGSGTSLANVSPATRWQAGQPSASKVRRPAAGSPGGTVDCQPSGTPPCACSAGIPSLVPSGGRGRPDAIVGLGVGRSRNATAASTRTATNQTTRSPIRIAPSYLDRDVIHHRPQDLQRDRLLG